MILLEKQCHTFLIELTHLVKRILFPNKAVLLGETQNAEVFAFPLIRLSPVLFVLTTEITEFNPQTVGWVLNAVCLGYPCQDERVSVFHLKQDVTMGFILWFSQLGSMFSRDNNSHHNPQFRYAKENFKSHRRKRAEALSCLLMHPFASQPQYGGTWEGCLQNRAHDSNTEGD